MKFCICGGGSLGHVMASVISSKGYSVNLLTKRPASWNHRIVVTDMYNKIYNGIIDVISDNPYDVIPDADVVLLCLPGYLIADELIAIKACLKYNAIVGSIVSSTGFFLIANNYIKNNTLFGFQRVPYIARVNDYGHSANILGYKSSVNIAFSNNEKANDYIPIIEDIIQTPVLLLDNPMEASLTNSNPILHPARLYSLFSNWAEGTTYNKEFLFYEEWNDNSSEILIKCDSEFMMTIDKLPIKKGTIPSLLDYYESSNAEELTRKIRSIPAFKKIKAPMKKLGESCYVPDFNNRYFTEDIPFGLIIIKYYAEQNNVPTPHIDQLLSWAQRVMNKEYIVDGRLVGKDICNTAVCHLNNSNNV